MWKRLGPNQGPPHFWQSAVTFSATPPTHGLSRQIFTLFVNFGNFYYWNKLWCPIHLVEWGVVSYSLKRARALAMTFLLVLTKPKESKENNLTNLVPPPSLAPLILGTYFILVQLMLATRTTKLWSKKDFFNPMKTK